MCCTRPENQQDQPPNLLARLGTVGSDASPHVTPVGRSRTTSTRTPFDVTERAFAAATKKYLDATRTGRAAIVIDDLASTDPWRPRGVEVRGRAETLSEPHPHPDPLRPWVCASSLHGRESVAMRRIEDAMESSSHRTLSRFSQEEP